MARRIELLEHHQFVKQRKNLFQNVNLKKNAVIPN